MAPDGRVLRIAALRLTRVFVSALLVIFARPSLLAACSVPVFRYALERDSWSPAPYRVFLFHDKPLEAQVEATVDILKTSAASDANVPANVTLEVVDSSRAMPEPVENLWKSFARGPSPLLVACLPGTFRPVWSARAEPAAAEALLHSPVRREIQRRIAAGDAAVWILLDSGDPVADEAALECVVSASRDFARDFRFSAEAMEAMGLLDRDSARVSISTIHLGIDQPEEAVLRGQLLGSEPDLRGYREPIAFLVFGRGRTLWALVGEGISADNVQQTCAYIAGDCSCQIKEQNPGIDLLMSCDWYKILAGVGPPAEVAELDTAASAAEPTAAPGILFVFGVASLTILALSLRLRHRSEKA